MNAKHVGSRRDWARIGGGLACLAIAVTAFAQVPAQAAERPSPAGVVVASQASASALADRPGGITVLDHDGQAVTISAKGDRPRVLSRPVGQPVTFTGLTLGKPYSVRIGTEFIGSVIPVTTPAAASRLVVATTDREGQVSLSWKQAAKAHTGSLTYRVEATSPGLPAVNAAITNGGVLGGLDLDARYTFTVTPFSSAGAGKPAIATMDRSLRELGAVSSTPVTPVPSGDTSGSSNGDDTGPVQPIPSLPPTTPTTPTGPRIRVIMVCPDGYTDTGSVCTKATPYTYNSIPYTYHPVTRTWTVRVVDGAVPMGDTWQPGCADGWCPTSWHEEVRSETTLVKDGTPEGYSDNGSSWVRRNAAPSGFVDDGTQWVTTTSKVAKEVPV